MMLDTNAFQSKPPLLDEAPIMTQPDVENGSPVKKSTRSQRCMGFIKLTLYLELIIFVGWIGCIFIMHYYEVKDNLNDDDSSTTEKSVDVVTRMYRDDETTMRNRFDWKDDFPVDHSSVSTELTTDDIVTRFKEEIGAIVNADQSRISTTSVMPVANDSVNTEAPAISSEKTTEASTEIPMSGWSGVLNIPDFEDDYEDDSVKENNNSDTSGSDTIIDRIIFPDDPEYSPPKARPSGLIHVIDYHMNVAPEPNVSRPFPRLPSLDRDTADPTEMPKVEADVSTVKTIKWPSESANTPSDDFGSREDDVDDYLEPHIKEILFPVGDWDDYSHESDEDDDSV